MIMKILMKNEDHKKLLINRLKSFGEYLIRNAEDIVGDPSNVSSIYISGELLDLDSVPTFNISKDYLIDDISSCSCDCIKKIDGIDIKSDIDPRIDSDVGDIHIATFGKEKSEAL